VNSAPYKRTQKERKQMGEKESEKKYGERNVRSVKKEREKK
jgi:hypothetical protein